MARMSVAGEDPASTDVERPIEDLLRACTTSALHIEMRDYYTPGDPWLRSWLDGDMDAFGQQLDRSWLDLTREVTGRGVQIRRLRVVSEPVSDYIRFEHATTDSNVAAGEQVRWLPRTKAADLLLPGNDGWIFDRRLVLFNFFDGPGDWVRTELRDDEEVATRLADAFTVAWERGIPHADYRLALRSLTAQTRGQVPVPSSSSAAQQARQVLADRLREVRVDAGLTALDLAARAGWERTKVSKIEHATRPPSAEAIRIWCRICGADDQADGLVASLRAAEGMWIEWRRMERTGLRLAQEGVLPLYERTRQFRIYASWIMPGLVQTEDYTRAVLRAYQQRRGLRDDVEDAVAARLRRQRLLRREGRVAAIVMEESLLRTGFGGPEVMAGQRAHLLEVTRWPAVSLGIIPAGLPDRGPAGPAEDFYMFDSELVACELISGYLSVTQPEEIAMYAQMFARLGEVAVYGARARELIASAQPS